MYQNARPVFPAGAVKVCAIEESPLVMVVDPTRAADVPACAPVLTTLVLPAVVQSDRFPVSNPPLVTPPPVPLTVRV